MTTGGQGEGREKKCSLSFSPRFSLFQKNSGVSWGQGEEIPPSHHPTTGPGIISEAAASFRNRVATLGNIIQRLCLLQEDNSDLSHPMGTLLSLYMCEHSAETETERGTIMEKGEREGKATQNAREKRMRRRPIRIETTTTLVRCPTILYSFPNWKMEKSWIFWKARTRLSFLYSGAQRRTLGATFRLRRLFSLLQ